MTTSVQFGPLTMTASLPVGDGAYVVERPFFDAWYTLSDSKSEIRERPSADGAFGIDRDWRSGLTLPVTGRFRGSTWPSMLAALQAVVAAGAPVTVTVTDDLGVSSRTVNVRRFEPHPMPGAKLCYFDMILFAPDSRRYGPLVSTSTGLAVAGTGQPWPQVWPAPWGTGGTDGRITLTNSGSASTAPLLIVTGGLSAGVELVEVTTGAYLRLDRIIPAGSTVYFNTRTSRIYLDSPANDISGFATRRDWEGFQIPAGGSRVIQFNNPGIASGSPLLTAQYSPAS